MATRAWVPIVVLVLNFYQFLAERESFKITPIKCTKKRQRCNVIDPNVIYEPFDCKRRTLLPTPGNVSGFLTLEEKRRLMCSEASPRQEFQNEILVQPLGKLLPTDDCDTFARLEVKVISWRKITNITVAALGTMRWSLGNPLDMHVTTLIIFRPYLGQNVTLRLLLEDLDNYFTIIDCLIPIRKECQSHKPTKCTSNNLKSSTDEETEIRETEREKSPNRSQNVTRNPPKEEEEEPEGVPIRHALLILPGFVIGALVTVVIAWTIKKCRSKDKTLEINAPSKDELDILGQDKCQSSMPCKYNSKIEMPSIPDTEPPLSQGSHIKKHTSHESHYQPLILNNKGNKYASTVETLSAHEQPKRGAPELPSRNKKSTNKDPDPRKQNDVYVDPDSPPTNDEYVDSDPPLKNDLYVDPDPPMKNDLYVDPDPPMKNDLYVDPDPPMKNDLYVDPDPPMKNDLYVDPDPPMKNDERVNQEPPQNNDWDPEQPQNDDEYFDPDPPQRNDLYVDPDTPMENDKRMNQGPPQNFDENPDQPQNNDECVNVDPDLPENNNEYVNVDPNLPENNSDHVNTNLDTSEHNNECVNYEDPDPPIQEVKIQKPTPKPRTMSNKHQNTNSSDQTRSSGSKEKDRLVTDKECEGADSAGKDDEYHELKTNYTDMNTDIDYQMILKPEVKQTNAKR